MHRPYVHQFGVRGVAALALAALQAVSPPSLRAQPAPVVAADQVAPPSFRSGVARVTVEAVVVDEGGTPVRNLGPSDFVLAVDGRPRRIQSVALVDFGSESVARASEASLPEVSTNTARTTSRTILLVFDRGSLSVADSLRVRQAASDFIARLQPADRLGLVSVPDGPSVEPTRDHQRVATALADVTGTAADPTWPRVGFREAFDIDAGRRDALAPVVARECQRSPMPETCATDVRQRARQIVTEGSGRAQAMLSALAATVARFAAVPGPKSIVLLSQGLSYGDRIPQEVGEIGRAASRAALPIYSVQLAPDAVSAAEAGPPPDRQADQAMLADALWGFAQASGGTVLIPVGRLESAFAHVARELSASYVLSFDVEAGDRDGAPHRIDLKLARGSSRLVRHRREFTSATVDPASDAVGDDPTLARLIDVGDVRSDLPMQVSTFTSPRADTVGQRTTAWAHIGAATATTIRMAIFDARNIRVADVTEQVTPTGGGAPAQGGIDHIVSAGLPAGRYVLRVAARDAEGRAGNVEHAFDARLAGTSELRVGSLLLLDERTVGNKVPTPILESGQAVGFRAYLELQSDGAIDWSTVQATLEAVDVGTGGVCLTRPLAVLVADRSSRRVAQAVIPLSGWARGSYVLRASVSLDGKPVATLVRGLVVDSDTSRLTTLRPAPAAPVTRVTDTVTAADDAIGEVVALGTRFVDDHNERSAAVVAEEQYVQLVLAGPAEPHTRNVNPALEWRPDFSRAARGVRDAKLRRQL
ncbi:MAG TPA: VWA domain-containing protein, partial [Luteitalea sp.]|nr:VWA domain-containing protein [Luteitalea sp.]